MAGKHALFSPSGFKALMLCPAKPTMERGLPDDASEYADEGTAAHFLGSECLAQEMTPVRGDVIAVPRGDGTCGWLDGKPAQPDPDFRYFAVDAEMVEAVQVYLDTVRDYVGDGSLFVEQALPIGQITGEDGAEGTGDAIIVRGDEIIVVDLKYGRGVEVSAEDNPQLMLYGLGALEKFDLVGDVARVRMVICQPRVSAAPSEFVLDVQALRAWGREVATPAAAHAARIYFGDDDMQRRPHADACRFCKAKGTCPSLADSVQTALAAEFTDLTTADATAREEIVQACVTAAGPDDLGAKMDAVELVEMWCKAIRARVEGELLAGRPVAGYKLVAGRKSARQWADEQTAEAALKSMRLKREVMYELKLISPTSAEKVLKATPKRWRKVEPLIVQNGGKPSVAPLADKRAALEIKPVESEFVPIAETAEDLV